MSGSHMSDAAVRAGPAWQHAISLPWSVELTFPSLLTVAGQPPATVAPPRRKKMPPPSRISSPHRRRGAPVSYLPLPHARRVASPSWVLDRRRLRCLRRCGIADARTVAGRAGRGRPGKRRSCAAHTGRAPRGHGLRMCCAHGPSRRRERGPHATVQLGRTRIKKFV
jgi:hypothetical protein